MTGTYTITFNLEGDGGYGCPRSGMSTCFWNRCHNVIYEILICILLLLSSDFMMSSIMRRKNFIPKTLPCGTPLVDSITYYIFDNNFISLII